ncbi:MAG: PhoH family protein [Chitinophagales bacterium]|nr:PhoH family protein [Chitinophagales bacterium]OJV27772.1 MAG: phosphate starvation-inducible protein PhoH [Bacteroidetes bacterium 37-13]
MTELTLQIEGIDPIDFFGVNNSRFNFIKKSFPTIRMVSRGNSIKAEGTDDDLQNFKRKISQMIASIERYGKLNEESIENILLSDKGVINTSASKEQNHVIVYGNNGLVVRARTENQRLMAKESETNDIIFAIGPAGTGKTYTAVALAVKALKEKAVKKIILTRPAVEAGENLGFLPGDLKEKVDPYLRPLYDALEDMIPADKLKYYMENRIIEVAPLAFMRGRTLDFAFILLDEAQNCTNPQLKMFLTRIGAHSKCIITGDPTQIDLPRSQQSGLHTAVKILRHIEGISFIRLNEDDVVRHRLVKEIIKAYDTISDHRNEAQEILKDMED